MVSGASTDTRNAFPPLPVEGCNSNAGNPAIKKEKNRSDPFR